MHPSHPQRMKVIKKVTGYQWIKRFIFQKLKSEGEIMSNIHERIIDSKEVQKFVPYSRSSIWRLEKAGLFPKRIKLIPNGRKVGWKLSAIMEWIESKK
jgi:predicted DNA-binding transcriptional regulator AlpA